VQTGDGSIAGISACGVGNRRGIVYSRATKHGQRVIPQVDTFPVVLPHRSIPRSWRWYQCKELLADAFHFAVLHRSVPRSWQWCHCNESKIDALVSVSHRPNTRGGGRRHCNSPSNGKGIRPICANRSFVHLPQSNLIGLE
jgi:hypothetical protein